MSSERKERRGEEEPPKEGLFKKFVKKHPWLGALVVSGAVHTAGDVAVEHYEPNVDEVGESLWERKHTVVEPQSKEERAAIVARRTAREARIDHEALRLYEADAAKKIAEGKSKSFKRMRFDLEKLHGMSPDEVNSAEQKAEAEIKKYSGEIGGDLDPEKAIHISNQMYGPKKAANWGQGSVTRYFNNHDRNCVAIARAQVIVFEGVLMNLPLEKRVRWQLATQFVKQHEIAVLEHLREDGTRDASYLLEGQWSRKWTDDEPGTVTLPIEDAKRALVMPIEVQAAGKSEEVKDSPHYDVDTDEPGPYRITIVGKLRGSEFNAAQAKWEDVVPREMTAAERAIQDAQEKKLAGKVVELEVRTGASDIGVEAAQQRVLDAPGHTAVDPWGNFPLQNLKLIDARDLDAPSSDTVNALGEIDHKSTARLWRHYFGSMEHWQPDALSQALRNNVVGISVQTKADGRLSENFLHAYAMLAQSEENFGPQYIKIEYAGKNKMLDGNIDPADLRLLLTGSGLDLVDISDLRITDLEKVSEVLKGMASEKTVIMPSGVHYNAGGRDAYLLFGQIKGTVMMPYDAYGELIGKHPELLDNSHFVFNPRTTLRELGDLRKIIEGIRPGHPLLRAIDKLNKVHEGMDIIGDEQLFPNPHDLTTPGV